MTHVLVAIPTPEYLHNEFALGNLPELVGTAKAQMPELKVTIAHQTGVRTDANRNAILKKAREDGTIDYILWLDADMTYQPDIIVRYLKDMENMGKRLDVIGCMYFKRSYPYNAVAYDENTGEDKNIKPYKTILPSAIKDDTIYEVAALGYGGMMVSMDVYDKLGDKKWTKYGENFHLPFDCEGHLTHDLLFCRDVKEAGMIVNLHGGVQAKHLATKAIEFEDWQKAFREEFTFHGRQPKVLVVIPTTNEEQAKLAAEVMRKRAGADCDIAIVTDDKHDGFIKIVNAITQTTDHEVIVYTAQDALVGQNWLKHALIEMVVTNAGLVGFNDGKHGGRLASFGMVLKDWVKNVYDKGIFHDGYFAHYADTELTQIAKEQGRYAYAEKAVMLEVDYQKAVGRGKGVVKADKKLYKKRKKNGFGGLVSLPGLIEEFS